MAFNIIITSEAQADLDEAFIYYDNISSSLSDRFLVELEETYYKLSNNPQHYSYISAIIRTTLRDVKLPSFPYVVIYDSVGDNIYIVRVRNCYQKPLTF